MHIFTQLLYLERCKSGFLEWNILLGSSKTERLTILALSLACAAVLVMPVSAGYPVVSDVIVWNNGGNTVLNVTVSHDPQTTFHYLDRIEVDVSGDNRVFPVAYRPETTFVVQCDLGIIETPTNATVRVHCLIDGYSLSLYGPILVPEFSSMLLLLLFSIATLLAVTVYRRKQLAIERR